MDWQAKYNALCDRLMKEFTPGGSEFFRDPERCIAFANIAINEGRVFRVKVTAHLNRHPFIRWLYQATYRRDRAA